MILQNGQCTKVDGGVSHSVSLTLSSPPLSLSLYVADQLDDVAERAPHCCPPTLKSWEQWGASVLPSHTSGLRPLPSVPDISFLPRQINSMILQNGQYYRLFTPMFLHAVPERESSLLTTYWSEST